MYGLSIMQPLTDAELSLVSGGGFFQHLFHVGSHNSTGTLSPASAAQAQITAQSINVGIGDIIAAANSTIEINIISMADPTSRRHLLGGG